ncbi:MAG: hypothetical protein DWP95_12935 [Proteobacteria bacterium]|nr:MAG: hypothetical protein DWP95_12935 [Pseudomonadota bacterium]
MKHFKQKVCIIGGLLISSIAVSQTVLENELSLQAGDSIEKFSWQKDFRENPQDSDVMQNKTYGEISGVYQLIFAGSSASALNTESAPVYGGAGCIYSPVGSTSFAAYDVPLQIPSGHSILGMRYAWSDTSASSSRVVLYSIDNTGTFATEQQIDSTGDTGYDSTFATLPGGLLIDNFTHKYGLRFITNEDGNTQEMCAVRLEIDSTP